jgi:hypothetical protein
MERFALIRYLNRRVPKMDTYQARQINNPLQVFRVGRRELVDPKPRFRVGLIACRSASWTLGIEREVG